jgi:hypothetical protein
MKKTAVEWLAEKLEYVNWMRNRDEIFPELADKWRKHYLEQAKEMEKEQIIKAYIKGFCNKDITAVCNEDIRAKQYYYETFKSE